MDHPCIRRSRALATLNRRAATLDRVHSIRRRLNSAQRIILVVGLGVVTVVLGSYISSLGGFGPQFGWFGYAPLTGNTLIGDQGSLTSTEQLLVWLGLVAVWAVISVWLFQDDYRDYDPQNESTQDD